ncbi:hypothetical protein GRI34_01670 [Erythrobacter aquimaris]|uniref:Glycosyltransferase RgtA/B/C/D-like domain-containing protein n=1 Tax=Qipengyuania aquimaris TaxID=255984 RepID=A0A6I4TGW8_9SPHN|nr:hypothetical protein [Qipengyuania aquimaris]MXO95124.1 hypothetical protein [Qipengyuania aquimaris]
MNEAANRAGHWRSKPHGALFSASLLLCFFTLLLSVIDTDALPRYYFVNQDRWAAAYFAVILGLLAFYRETARPRVSPPRFREICLAAFVVVVTGYVGHYLLLFGYPVTRDELMAEFDAEIFASGELAANVAPQWRDYVVAMAPHFRLPIHENAAWASAYLPMNAMIRAGFGSVFDPSLLNPLLAGIGLIALCDAAKRLFPESATPQWVVLGGYLLSAQILITGMTSYAMTGHLATSSVWLSLFLRDTRWSHAGAMAIGVLAIGLHQIAFHPLFAGPILLTLLLHRRWYLFAVYALTYGAAILGFTSYHSWVAGGYDFQGSNSLSEGGSAFFDFLRNQVLPLLRIPSISSFLFMEWNLLRFFAFMPAFVLPLLLLSGRALKSNRGISVPLMAGLLITLAVLFLVIPYQGHGWGFRYLHGLLPSVLLLCAYGYASLQQENGGGRALPIKSMALATLPAIAFLTVSSQKFVAPYAEATEIINQQDGDFVLVDTTSGDFAVDLVRNDPYLRNRPLIFDPRFLTQDNIAELCGRGTISLVRKTDLALPEIGSSSGETIDIAALEEWLSSQECYRTPVAK